MSAEYYEICFHSQQESAEITRKILPFQDSELLEERIIFSKLLTKRVDPTVPHVYEITIRLSKKFCRESNAGDTIGILPKNEEKEICAILDKLDLSDKIDHIVEIKGPKIPVHVPVNGSTLKEIFMNNLDIRSIPSKLFLKSLAAQTKDAAEIERLNEICKTGNSLRYCEFVNGDARTLLGLLRSLPGCRPTLSTLIKFLPSLKPRPYSIVAHSFELESNRNVRIAFSVRHGNQKGVCSGYLQRICENRELRDSETIQFYFRKPTDFRMPYCDKQRVIMIATGTGIAPFMGFLEKRGAGESDGGMILYYGCRYKKQDFIYKNTLKDYQNHILTKLYTTFSRDGPQKVYIQERIKETWEEFYDSIANFGAYIFVCGDAKTMMVDVKQTIQNLLIEASGLSEEEAKNFLDNMEKSKRYVEDKWF